MRRFVEQADRGQWTQLPECLNDFIDENNPVRVIDAFVDALDLAEMSLEGGRMYFTRQDPKPTRTCFKTSWSKLCQLILVSIQNFADLQGQSCLSDRFFQKVNALIKSAMVNDCVARITSHVKNPEMWSDLLRASSQLASLMPGMTTSVKRRSTCWFSCNRIVKAACALAADKTR